MTRWSLPAWETLPGSLLLLPSPSALQGGLSPHATAAVALRMYERGRNWTTSMYRTRGHTSVAILHTHIHNEQREASRRRMGLGSRAGNPSSSSSWACLLSRKSGALTSPSAATGCAVIGPPPILLRT
ncbi:hypothetical protein CC78DRAFT_547878 [Lojkania enalia]|uniref:Uncharacterized protein n=1 Tax=Lojkania enalia TaxID=147567 RepID=A0A9P4JZ88_9PLEO|nr:hypothetical protein CC78DRAFT_547878 [Didymosphaeria enalia]